jgi:hypothetical protein
MHPGLTVPWGVVREGVECNAVFMTHQVLGSTLLPQCLTHVPPAVVSCRCSRGACPALARKRACSSGDTRVCACATATSAHGTRALLCPAIHYSPSHLLIQSTLTMVINPLLLLTHARAQTCNITHTHLICRYFSSQQLSELFAVDEEGLASSATQRQLAALHASQRITSQELAAHLQELQSMEGFAGELLVASNGPSLHSTPTF